MKDKTRLKLIELIKDREQELNNNHASSDDVKNLKKRILNYFTRYNIDYCSHNLALLGSKRYASYKIPGVETFIPKESRP